MFNESLTANMYTYLQYRNLLYNMATNRFLYHNIPLSMDIRYLENTLLTEGKAIFFKDDVLDDLLCLSVDYTGNFDIYGYPIERMAYSRYSSYHKKLNKDDSVLIFNNTLKTPDINLIGNYAKRLYNLDRIMDINANCQKTPGLIKCSEKQRLSLINMYKEWDGNQPLIAVDKDLDLSGFTYLSTGAPFIADKLQSMKEKLWSEVLTYLGIDNLAVIKKERALSDEIETSQTPVMINRMSLLNCRKEAIERVNIMFGTDISVEWFGGDE